MKDFDLRKYLAKNPLNEAYTPGSGWTKDFDYDDMLAQGLKVSVDTPVEDLEKMFADFEDVNYHREGEHLSYAIDALKDGNKEEAEDYIKKFRKEIKKTIADYSDEYFDVNEGREGQFDVEATERIAQKVADAFTAEDDELDLKYVVTPGTSENSFDLDVEAGPNTPGEDWKDVNGFGIENYLGKYAGGSFYIKDGVVYNAASRNAKVANVSPEGEVEMISAEDSRADLDAIDAQRKKETQMANIFVREENKSNKMKKSELKEMIRQAMLAEVNGKEDKKNIEETDFWFLNTPPFEESLKEDWGGSDQSAMNASIHRDLGNPTEFPGLTQIMRAAEDAVDFYWDEWPEYETDRDGLIMHAAQMYANKMFPEFMDNMRKMMTPMEETLYEADEEVDVEADTETADAEVATDDTETVDVEATAEISPEVKATQDALTAAIEAAKALGDQKLADQIGNSITFFTRTHVVGQDKVAEGVEMPANVVNKANIAVKDAPTMAATMLDLYKQIQDKEQVDMSKNQTFKMVLNYLEKLASQAKSTTPAPAEKEEVAEEMDLFELRMLKNAGIKK